MEEAVHLKKGKKNRQDVTFKKCDTMQEVPRPLQTLTAHCSSLSSSAPPRPDTSVRPPRGPHMDTSGQHGLQTEVSHSVLFHLFIYLTFTVSFHQHRGSARHHVCSCGFYFTSSRAGTGSFPAATLSPADLTAVYVCMQPIRTCSRSNRSLLDFSLP